MRTALPLALAVLAVAAAPAQTPLRLVGPALTVGAERVGVVGGPVLESRLGVLRIDVPGTGTYHVSDRPLDGTRRAGEFEGRGLFFAAGGQSVRLVSREPILPLGGPVPAFVRFDPDPARRAGPARLTVADVARTRARPAAAARPGPVRTAGPRRATGGRAPVDPARRLRAEIERLEAERSRLIEERGQIARALDQIEAQRRARSAELVELHQRAQAGERRGAGWAEPERALRTARDAELQDLRAQRDALRAERDRLQTELSLRDRARSEQTVQAPAPSRLGAEAGAPGGAPDAPGRAAASLPGFDFARLQNPDEVRRRLREAAYPRWAAVGRIEGDVLVMFQTDPTGRVVRTAVPIAVGGGLDALAEELVGAMRFVPPVVDGQATGLRSQVVVQFELGPGGPGPQASPPSSRM